MPRYMITSEKTDLNTIVDVGFYSVKNPINAPSGYTNWCNVIVLQTGANKAYPMQILIRHSTDQIPYMCIRIASENVFSDWYTFAPVE